MGENKIDVKVDKDKEKRRKQANRILWIFFIILLVIIVAFVGVIIYAGYLLEIRAGEMMVKKPVIYLYPEEEMAVDIKLGNPERLVYTYPAYTDGWKVVAKPDGTLIDRQTNREYYSLFWEGNSKVKNEITEGFVIKGEDTVAFLEEKLELLGLNSKEAQEFIIYWLPILQENKYNYIRFAAIEEITEYMPLEFSVKPDTLIRVLMVYSPLDKYIEIPEQKLTSQTREGFVVVEWGGTKIEI